jgi:putative tricarboxylic transport membrane protein
VLALVLGDLAENALRQSLIMSQGSLMILFERPISGVISAVAVFFFALPVLQPYLRRARKSEIAAAAAHDAANRRRPVARR